jgi:sec-independent protein translocase protein TatB
VFGFSFGELLVISLVTLVAVGPQKLPGVLKTMGQWARKLRKMTLDVRQQTGIDEMLRAEGIQLSELRSLMRGYHPPSPSPAPAPAPSPVSATVSATTSVSSAARNDDPYLGLEPDPTREYPPEGADAYGALPDDLLEPPRINEVGAAPGQPDPEPAPPPPVADAPAPAPPVIAPAPPVVAPAPPVVAPAPPVVAPAPPVFAPAPPVIAPAPPVVAEPALSAAAPASVRARSLPPPPPSRSGAPRPSSGPPPPPRRAAPPRPEPSDPVSKPEAPAGAVVPPTPGSVNGNG